MQRSKIKNKRIKELLQKAQLNLSETSKINANKDNENKSKSNGLLVTNFKNLETEEKSNSEVRVKTPIRFKHNNEDEIYGRNSDLSISVIDNEYPSDYFGNGLIQIRSKGIPIENTSDSPKQTNISINKIQLNDDDDEEKGKQYYNSSNYLLRSKIKHYQALIMRRK